MKTTAALAALIALVAVACGGGEKKDEAVSPTTSVGASVTPTALASSTPQAAACPVDQRICSFALTLLPILQRGDIDAFVALSEPVPAKCTSAQGFGGPSPTLCRGAAEGETRYGYWDVQAGEGLVVTEAEWRTTLDRWRTTILAATGSDSYGSGALRIASVGCFREPSQPTGSCSGWIDIHFTYINSTDASQAIGPPGQRMTFYVRAHFSGSALKAEGVGFGVPPNAALEPLRLDAVDSSGRRGVFENYVWRP